jgi:hypothetical protein
VVGCGKKADENKPIVEVKAEAKVMDADELREMAIAYKEAILAKKEDVERIKDKIKEIPITEIISEETAKLKDDVEELLRSVGRLKERFEIYYENLIDKKGDLSALDV